MELINMYIREVISYLPKVQRKDVEGKLRYLINDMMKKYPPEEPETAKAEKVISELGDPKILAKKYSGNRNYLIGSKYHSSYVFVLKIVLASLFLGISISSFLGGINSPEKSLSSIILEYLSSLILGIFQGVLWVTVIFAVIGYKGSDLPNIPSNKGLKNSLKDKGKIPVGEGIVGIIFTTIFMMILYFSPQLFAAYIPIGNGGFEAIPIFNTSAFKQYDAFILTIFLVSIAKESVKIVYRRWTITSSILYSLLNIVATVLVLIIFLDPNIWNTNFFPELFKGLNIQISSNNNIELVGRRIINGIIVFILAINILEISKSLYKAVKYNSTSSL